MSRLCSNCDAEVPEATRSRADRGSPVSPVGAGPGAAPAIRSASARGGPAGAGRGTHGIISRQDDGHGVAPITSLTEVPGRAGGGA